MGVKRRSGRKKGYVHDVATREKIRSGMLLYRLEGIVDGTIKGDPVRLGVQVRAALGLLKKCLPDLQSTDITSGGKSILVERTQFKRKAVDNGNKEKEDGQA